MCVYVLLQELTQQTVPSCHPPPLGCRPIRPCELLWCPGNVAGGSWSSRHFDITTRRVYSFFYLAHCSRSCGRANLNSCCTNRHKPVQGANPWSPPPSDHWNLFAPSGPSRAMSLKLGSVLTSEIGRLCTAVPMAQTSRQESVMLADNRQKLPPRIGSKYCLHRSLNLCPPRHSKTSVLPFLT